MLSSSLQAAAIKDTTNSDKSRIPFEMIFVFIGFLF